jgi:hypothetical protein
MTHSAVTQHHPTEAINTSCGEKIQSVSMVISNNSAPGPAREKRIQKRRFNLNEALLAIQADSDSSN